MILEKKTIAYC